VAFGAYGYGCCARTRPTETDQEDDDDDHHQPATADRGATLLCARPARADDADRARAVSGVRPRADRRGAVRRRPEAGRVTTYRLVALAELLMPLVLTLGVLCRRHRKSADRRTCYGEAGGIAATEGKRIQIRILFPSAGVLCRWHRKC